MIPAMVDLLATFYQSGNLVRMEAIARTMLAVIPNDVVALQFLGLSLYLTGRIEDAYRVFKRAAAPSADSAAAPQPMDCEPAATVSYREAVRPGSRLADGWLRIAEILREFRLHKIAAQALEAARVSRGLPPTDRRRAEAPRRSAERGAGLHEPPHPLRRADVDVDLVSERRWIAPGSLHGMADG